MTKVLIIEALRQPDVIKHYSAADWSRLLQQLRLSQLSLYFLQQVESANLTAYLPVKIGSYLKSEKFKVAHQKRQVIYEVTKINQALALKQITPVYLKGVAYILADIPLASTRVFSDIDILVPKKQINACENSLKGIGFISEKTDDYDQAYYRDYMHEIPPMRHVIRGSELDVHHNILPICTNSPINVDALTDQLSNDSIGCQSKTFAPPAMFLHSAIHLFHEGEFDKGLRDLCDLAELYEYYLQHEQEFEPAIIALAHTLNQQHSLFLALRYIHRILAVKLGENSNRFLISYQKNYRWVILDDFIFEHVLRPFHPSCEGYFSSIAKHLAYYRGHMLRMPLKLLIPHLLKKTWKQINQSMTKDQNKQHPDF